jgi:S-adenosyl-L-methionine hydrolase (adenosine-forming)
MGIITLCTDFGTKDPYAGIMKGVILAADPKARIVDITHEIEAQDVREAAFTVQDYWGYFPAGTVHVVVVDPTVGSARRPIALSCDGHFFVGPDNGVLSFVARRASEVRVIENRDLMREEISATFHGRDIFGPVGAHLLRGIALSDLGPKILDPVMLDDIYPAIRGTTMTGDIARFDHFGNAITNIGGEHFRAFIEKRPYRISINEYSFDSLSRSYCEGEITCLTGSAGYIEFGVFRGDFRTKTGARKRDPVIIKIQ